MITQKMKYALKALLALGDEAAVRMLAERAEITIAGATVRIDGIDVRDLTLDSLRTSIGVVSQDPHLFHESIGENLRYADPTATDDDVVTAHARPRRRDAVIVQLVVRPVAQPRGEVAVWALDGLLHQAALPLMANNIAYVIERLLMIIIFD
mgnify:CR=1 FL=1